MCQSSFGIGQPPFDHSITVNDVTVSKQLKRATLAVGRLKLLSNLHPSAGSHFCPVDTLLAVNKRFVLQYIWITPQVLLRYCR